MSAAKLALARAGRHLPAVVLVLGIAVFGWDEVERQSVRPLPAEGSFWAAFAEDDEPLLVLAREQGVVIAPGDVLRLRDAESPQWRLTSLRMRLQRAGTQSCAARWRFRDHGTAQYRLMLVPGTLVSATLALQEEGEAPVELASIQRAGLLPDLTQPFEIALRLDGPRMQVDLNGEALLQAEDARLADGELSFSADGLRVLDIAVDGVATAADGSTQPVSMTDDLTTLRDTRGPPWAPLLGDFALLLGLLLLAAGWLRALCRDVPPRGAVWRATALLLSPAAALLAVDVLSGWPIDVPPLVLLTGLGLLPASHVLRAAWRAPRTTRDPRRALAAVALLAAVAALATGTARSRVVQPLALAARRALPAVSHEPQLHDKELALDAGNALTLRGAYRSFDLHAQLVLEPGAVLEVRTRSAMGVAEGVALLVSAEPCCASGFARETESEFQPIGKVAGTVAAERPLQLLLSARGSRFTAQIDGQPAGDAWERRSPSGSLVLLAAKGAARVQHVQLQPVPEADVEDPSGEIARAAALPVLALLLAGLVGAWALGLPFARAAEGAGFALLPVAGATLLGEHDGRVPQGAFWGCLGLSVVLVSVFAAVHGRGRGVARGLLLPLLACVGGPALLLALTGPPVTLEQRPDMSAAELGVAPVCPDLVHFQHPLVRHFSTYLVEHRFRGRSFPLVRRPVVARVLCIGSSSTWGHAISDASGLDYPTLLEKRLREEDASRPVEVINGGVSGATSARLFPFLREVGLAFDPDVVTISLYYNDSYALSRVDERPYFERIVEPGYAHTLLDRVRLSFTHDAGARSLRRLLDRLPEGAGDCAAAWEEIGGASPPPPERFESNLAALAGLLQERGIPLVLIKEPVRGNHDRLWKREFYAAIDRVAARFGATVVDPSPALEAAGGAQLFVDDVHPSPRGNVVMAEVLAPVIGKLLAERGARHPPGAAETR